MKTILELFILNHMEYLKKIGWNVETAFLLNFHTTFILHDVNVANNKLYVIIKKWFHFPFFF